MTCTCNHLPRQHKAPGRMCKIPGCRCLYGPTRPAPALRKTPIRTRHAVNARGEVEAFERELTALAPAVQTLTITDWHPATSPNARGDWRVIHKRHQADQTMAWAAAQHAGWRYVVGKVSLTIVLVYPRTYHVDADNLAAKCKGLIDGLKLHGDRGFFRDDSTEWLELQVKADVRKGVKATELTLSAVSTTHQLALTGGTD